MVAVIFKDWLAKKESPGVYGFFRLITINLSKLANF